MAQAGLLTRSDYIPWDIAMSRANEARERKPVIASIIACGITLGLRISDIQALRVEQFSSDRLMIVEKKTGKPRVLTINPWLSSFLNKCVLPETGFLCSKDGSRPLSTQHINRELKTVFSDLDINVSSHSLRKTFGRRVMEQNNFSAESLLLLMEAFNHSSPAITKIYLGLREEEISKIYMNIV